MAHPDTLLTGSIMAVIAAALLFGDEDKSAPRDDEIEAGREVEAGPDSPPKAR
jgi:hypothetical protein